MTTPAFEAVPEIPQIAEASLAEPGVWKRMPKKVWVGFAIVAVYVLVAVLAPAIAPYDPLAIEPANRLASPDAAHLLGTDELGRDIFSRLLYAARIDIPIGFLGALLPAILGTILGAIAGFFGRWVDTAIMRTADVVQAFPAYILVIVLVFALGQGAGSIILAFTVLAWVIYARIIRSEVLRVRDRDYVQAARVAGLRRLRILRVHVFPNVINQTLVYLPNDIVFATLALAAFSFLGLGIPPPTPEWGAMIAEGQPFLRTNWWFATVPGLVIVGLGLGLSLIGEGLEEGLRA
ncbi:MAG: ABC transporter permease [Acidimicrobiia bacterium]|nr:ABC transporter permease [Acidimicrobiia bacterium]